MKYVKWVLIALVSLLVVGVGSFLFYVNSATYPPTAEAFAALQSNTRVVVTQDEWVTFAPRDEQPTVGFIFYPGGAVEYEAYAPHLRDIAAEGYWVALMPMPLNFAIFDADAATRVIERHPEIDQWVIGGHSLGGAMAAQWAAEQTELLAGLVLWASYPPNDLSATSLNVASIYGTQDGLVSAEELEASKSLLPPTAAFMPIEGGNHAQFGWYGAQEGDLSAALTAEEQQAQVVAATLTLLAQVEDSGR